MITASQKQEIINDLLAKNLPLDLLVEIKDHMEEQLDCKIDFENKSFDTAYAEVKKSWEKDLEMKFSILARQKRTKIHRDALNKTNNGILKRALFYFSPFFFLGALICIYNKNLASQFYYITYSIIGIITVISMILFYKYYNSTSINEKRKISIYQKGSLSYFIGGLYVIIFNLLGFDGRFEKFYTGINSIINGNYNIDYFIALLQTNFFIFLWGYGLLYFLKYKSAVSDLKNRINLKL